MDVGSGFSPWPLSAQFPPLTNPWLLPLLPDAPITTAKSNPVSRIGCQLARLKQLNHASTYLLSERIREKEDVAGCEQTELLIRHKVSSFAPVNHPMYKTVQWDTKQKTKNKPSPHHPSKDREEGNFLKEKCLPLIREWNTDTDIHTMLQ